MKCDWVTVDETDDEDGYRRWQMCRVCGAERKQRLRNNHWVTVYQMDRSTPWSFLRTCYKDPS